MLWNQILSIYNQHWIIFTHYLYFFRQLSETNGSMHGHSNRWPLDQIQPPSIYPALLFFFNFLFFFWGTVIWAANAAWASFSFASNTDACLLLQYDVEKEKGGRKRLYWSFFLPLLMSFLHIWEATVWSLCLTVREAGERLPSTPAPHPSLLFFWIGS